MDEDRIIREISDGGCCLGIELGSTRIKAVLIDSTRKMVASGNHDWENRNDNGIWTYSLQDIVTGLGACYSALKDDVRRRYGVRLGKLASMGVSAMMHGYMAFDDGWRLLTPFRTWRNTVTARESEELTALFSFPVPQRWTVSHLLLDIKKQAGYLPSLAHVCTLSSHVHRLLTGADVVGVGDASGMFPIDQGTMDYSRSAAEAFGRRYGYDIRRLFPKVLAAGEVAGYLTKEGALLLDRDGDLEPGCPLCPPEGDAGTGMVATNSILPRTGNVSAGTSAFAMVVLEKPLSGVYAELDLVTTPDGVPVAMAHTNNCTGGYDAWISVFSEVLSAMGVTTDRSRLYDVVLSAALEGDPDCGGLLSYNYISGEPITGLEEGRPLFTRSSSSRFNLANFMRSELYSAIASMRVGLDILFRKEGVHLDVMNCHGGYFKTRHVGLRMMASALGTPVRALSTAGEGGAWGIAVLASFLSARGMSLAEYLSDEVFSDSESTTFVPDERDCEGFDRYYRRYIAGLGIERAAVEKLEV